MPLIQLTDIQKVFLTDEVETHEFGRFLADPKAGANRGNGGGIEKAEIGAERQLSPTLFFLCSLQCPNARPSRVADGIWVERRSFVELGNQSEGNRLEATGTVAIPGPNRIVPVY